LSLREVFVHAHELIDIPISPPPAAAGMMRLLTVLLARMTGLDRIIDADEWSDVRDDLLKQGRLDPTEHVDRYFDQWTTRFDLFHPEHPFLQEPRLLEQCRNTKGEQVSSGLNKLVLGRAAGQAFVWRAHTTDQDPPPVAPEEAFVSLLNWLYYGPPGRCTSRHVPGLDKPIADTKGAPLRGSVSFHPWGSSLWETLLIGMPFVAPTGEDKPPWDRERHLDSLGVPPPAHGLASTLTGRFRHAVLLTPAPDGRSVIDARITWAWREDQAPTQDPYLIYQPSKDSSETLFALSARADRAVWRELDTLLRDTHDPMGRQRPAVFTSLEKLDYDTSPVEVADVRIRSFGFDQDRSQVKDRQYFSGTTPPLLNLLRHRDDETAVRLGESITAAEQTGRNLDLALTLAWARMSRTKTDAKRRDHGVPWLHEGMGQYWQEAETLFWDTMQAASPPDRSVRNSFIVLALRVYGTTTKAHARSLQQIKAVESARHLIVRGWQSDHPKEEE
jgi:CRISPR system Cascade subunit CasA